MNFFLKLTKIFLVIIFWLSPATNFASQFGSTQQLQNCSSILEGISTFLDLEDNVFNALLTRLMQSEAWPMISGIQFGGSRVHQLWRSSNDLDFTLIPMKSNDPNFTRLFELTPWQGRHEKVIYQEIQYRQFLNTFDIRMDISDYDLSIDDLLAQGYIPTTQLIESVRKKFINDEKELRRIGKLTSSHTSLVDLLDPVKKEYWDIVFEQAQKTNVFFNSDLKERHGWRAVWNLYDPDRRSYKEYYVKAFEYLLLQAGSKNPYFKSSSAVFIFKNSPELFPALIQLLNLGYRNIFVVDENSGDIFRWRNLGQSEKK
ncbi:MAG: hypothetical protein KDD40_00645 [Bdellovibrionales bacterium]|nr:hypothetical protein [Bdellovibrionales bacterium]